MVKWAVIWIGIFASIASKGYAQSPLQCYKIGFWQGTDSLEAAMSMVREIYEISGTCAFFIPMSLRKAEHDILENIAAGNAWRSDYFSAKHRNTLVTTFPIFQSDVTLFLNTKAYGKNPVKENVSNLRVGYYDGDVHALIELEKLKSIPSATNSYENVARAFFKGRYEAVIMPETLMIDYLDEKPNDFAFSSISLKEIKYRHILHRRHKDLIPILNDAIPQMLENGSLEDRIERLREAKEGQ